MCKKIVIAGCLLAASFSQAGEYQFEMGLDYAETDVDTGTEEDSYTVSGRYYLAPVDNSKGPLAEAAFLQRASHIDLSYQKIDWKSDAFLGIRSRRNANLGAVGATYIFKDSGWLFGVDYSDGKQDVSTYDEDQYGYNLRVGNYVAENTLVTLAYSESVLDYSHASAFYLCPVGVCALTTTRRISETTNDGFNLSLKHVGSLGRFNYSLQAGYSQGEEKFRSEYWSNGTSFNRFRYERDWTEENLDFAFYPSDRWRIGLGYRHNDSEGWDTEYYRVNVQWFVTNNVAVDIGYSEAKPQNRRFIAATFGSDLAFGQDIFDLDDISFTSTTPFFVPANSFSPISIADYANGGLVVAVPSSFDEETVSIGLRVRF